MQKKMYLMPQALQRGVPSSESRQSGVRLVLQEAQIFTEKNQQHSNYMNYWRTYVDVKSKHVTDNKL